MSNITKKQILQTSLELYNTYGLSKVSQRKITDVLGISPGNLTYHFKKKQDIARALYFELVQDIEHLQQTKGQAPEDIEQVMLLTKALFDCFYAYRFIFIDFVVLLKNDAVIATHYKELLLLREKQFIATMHYLISEDLCRPALLDNEYEFLFLRVRVFSDFYLSVAALEPDLTKQQHMQRYTQSILYALHPFLTQKGKQQFTYLIQELL